MPPDFLCAQLRAYLLAAVERLTASSLDGEPLSLIIPFSFPDQEALLSTGISSKRM